MTADVVIHAILILLTLDRHSDIKILKQVLFAVFKYAPHMVHAATTRLTPCFVEPNFVLVHITSAAGHVCWN